MAIIYRDYENLALIGRGAFASIWKVRHKDLDYVRAIKVSNEVVESEQDKAYQTFLRECKVLLRIGNGGHPNIVRIYQPHFIENHAIVEMDYIQGETLNEYLKRERFAPIEMVDRFVNDIAGALAYCHVDIYKFLMDPVADNLKRDPADGSKWLISPLQEQELIAKYGITHNDLHSNNVMLREVDGGFVLLDFGLAVQDNHSVKSSSRRDGASEYMAPEKWDPQLYPMGIGTWTDVYSLGVLLYEVLAGRVPFVYDVNAHPTELAAQNAMRHCHAHLDPPPIEPLRRAAFEARHPGSTYERDYPQWLEDLIMRCLAKNPGDRWANAKELLQAYRALKARYGGMTGGNALPAEPLPAPAPAPAPRRVITSPPPAAAPATDEAVQRLKHRVTTLKAQKKSATRRAWVWGVVAMLALASSALGWYNTLSGDRQATVMTDSLSRMGKDLKAADDVLATTKRELKTARNERDNLKRDYNSLKDRVAQHMPLIITSVEVGNSDGSDAVDYGAIWESESMYLKPRISYQGLKDGSREIRVKLYTPSGTLSKGSNSPAGCSYAQTIDIQAGEHTLELKGWGGPDRGHWQQGTYRFEIWCGDVCLKARTFRVE